jgi:hypothetical protein
MIADFHAHAIAQVYRRAAGCVLLLSSFVLPRLQETTNQPLLEK